MGMKKILLVDDSSTMLLLERLVLDSSGCQILTARDGQAGVRAALAHRPDLILLEGVEVGRQLQAHEATREIPTLLATRPTDDNELLSKVKNLLGMNSEGGSGE